MVGSIIYINCNLMYFYRFIGSLLYSLGHCRCGGSNIYIQQWAYRHWSTLYSRYCSLLEGINICLDYLYVLGILFLGSLGPDKLRRYGKGCPEGRDCGSKEGEYGGVFLACIKGLFL